MMGALPVYGGESEDCEDRRGEFGCEAGPRSDK